MAASTASCSAPHPSSRDCLHRHAGRGSSMNTLLSDQARARGRSDDTNLTQKQREEARSEETDLEIIVLTSAWGKRREAPGTALVGSPVRVRLAPLPLVPSWTRT